MRKLRSYSHRCDLISLVYSFYLYEIHDRKYIIAKNGKETDLSHWSIGYERDDRKWDNMAD